MKERCFNFNYLGLKIPNRHSNQDDSEWLIIDNWSIKISEVYARHLGVPTRHQSCHSLQHHSASFTWKNFLCHLTQPIFLQFILTLHKVTPTLVSRIEGPKIRSSRARIFYWANINLEFFSWNVTWSSLYLVGLIFLCFTYGALIKSV
jgi:hypothetical protein